MGAEFVLYTTEYVNGLMASWADVTCTDRQVWKLALVAEYAKRHHNNSRCECEGGKLCAGRCQGISET